MNSVAVTSGPSKPTLLLIHGWGMNPSLWDDLAQPLSEHFEVHCPALPGHGGTPPVPGWSAESLASDWLQAWPDAFWVGWSLGAQVALAAAIQAPEDKDDNQRVRGAVLLGGTPRFVATDDWSCAMPEHEFNTFQDQCKATPENTLQQFLGLQVLESAQSGRTLRALRQAVATAPAPGREGLLDGLRVLRNLDMRADLAKVRCPVLWLSGDSDHLTPHEAARWSATKMPHSQVECLPGAGHAPLISHKDEVLRQINAWLLEECS